MIKIFLCCYKNFLCLLLLGAGTAFMGKEAARACTVAVETVIAEHYNDQLRTLSTKGFEKYEDLRQVSVFLLKKCVFLLKFYKTYQFLYFGHTCFFLCLNSWKITLLRR